MRSLCLHALTDMDQAKGDLNLDMIAASQTRVTDRGTFERGMAYMSRDVAAQLRSAILGSRVWPSSCICCPADPK